tara:strand:+ start:4181 stop:6358 length:2178 start_codon:yes stop_codon:yes gene_type:complete
MKSAIYIVGLLLWANCLIANAVSKEDNSKSFWSEDVPLEMVSFGSSESGGYLYLHGGHKGKAHTYSKAHHENEFWRIELQPKGEWEKLKNGTPAQGYAMVSYKGIILKVGGSQATNEPEDAHNLHSIDEIESYNPKTNKWTLYGKLPEPRSSHEAVVVGDILYVFGGWDFGNGREEWLGCISADLSAKKIQWKILPEMPADRRAFSITHDNRYIYVVGGMDDGGTLTDFDIYDTKKNEWSRGPDLPSKGSLKGFGSAAGYVEGSVYVSDASESLHRYDVSEEKWHVANKLNKARFFHRIASFNGDLYVIGGTSMKSGAVKSIEKISLKAKSTARSGILDGNNWPGFRGDGSSLTLAKNLPSKWQDSDVKWSQQLEGYGQSSPVVFDGKVFITDVIGENKEKLGVHCYDLKTGKKVWSKLFDNKNIQKVSQYISKGSSTPCVDKYGVYCFFETGLLVAISHQGNIKWKRSVTEEYGAFEGNHGVGTSLVQSEGHLVLLIDHSAEGYLLKIDKKTGKNDWKNDREKRVSWSTPVIDTSISPNRIIISSNGIVEAISLKDGKQIWSFNGVQKNTIPSATLGGDLILVGSSEKPSSIALPGNKKGLLSKDQVQWTAENATSSMSSPLVIDGNVYYVNRAGVISCNDIKTGKKFWDHRLPSSCWTTPVGVDGLVYFFCKEGSTVIMKNDHEGPSEVFKNKLDIKGPVYGVAVVNNAIIMRTGSRLFSLMN